MPSIFSTKASFERASADNLTSTPAAVCRKAAGRSLGKRSSRKPRYGLGVVGTAPGVWRMPFSRFSLMVLRPDDDSALRRASTRSPGQAQPVNCPAIDQPATTAHQQASRAGQDRSSIDRLRRFLRFLSTEAPLLDRHYPASSLIRASPSPQTAQPDSHELPVDRVCHHRWGFPCCY
jgi:hypothetical protein